ncbi:hypothetical protein R6Q57_024366 [Mikania cordata]
MYAENWKKAGDFFLSDTHKKRSSSNAEVRQKQLYTNCGGPSAYSSYCYKNDQIAGLFKDPGFMEQLSNFIDLKNKKANTNDEGDSDEADE